MSHTLGQKRAAFCLEQLAGIDDKCRDDFKSFSAGLPSLILQNGFGQALAFLVAKGKDKADGKHLTAFRIISLWLADNNIKILMNKNNIAPAGRRDILLEISRLEQTKYLRAQQETLAMLEWLKRYANAELFGG